ncbi:MAG: type II toxin-antitoxin system VapC family toxin [Alphaproteobacteria bacterium]
MTIDLPAALRQLKPERRRAPLTARAPHARLAVEGLPPGRQMVVPDTCVYIDNAAGRLPAAAQAVVDRAVQFHCAVCLGEISTGLGNADPAAARYRTTIAHYLNLIARMPAARIIVPDDDSWVRAGLMAGTLARTQGYRPFQRKALLNDALIYLAATRKGLPVLTQNHDFDLLWQLHPAGTVIFY